jgi:hypothetical protein
MVWNPESQNLYDHGMESGIGVGSPIYPAHHCAEMHSLAGSQDQPAHNIRH